MALAWLGAGGRASPPTTAGGCHGERERRVAVAGRDALVGDGAGPRDGTNSGGARHRQREASPGCSGLALLLRVANRLGPLRVYGASMLIQRVIQATGLTGILLVQDAAP